MRVRFAYQYDDDGQQQAVTYDEQMAAIPCVGDGVNFKDRQVDVEQVTWNLDPSIPADVVVDLV